MAEHGEDRREVLSLWTEPAAQSVTIAGVRYAMRPASDLQLRDRATVVKLGRRVHAIEVQMSLGQGERSQELRQALIDLSSFALPDAPVELLERQPTTALRELAMAFFLAAARSRLAMGLLAAGISMEQLIDVLASEDSEEGSE